MDQRTKKQLIAGLLLASCIFSAWLFFVTPEQHTHQLTNLNQTDSLLHIALSDFNLRKDQVSTHTTQIDSNFSRKAYTIAIPPDFSKTQFHAVLKNRLLPYKISLPARVIFPEKDMHIYINYGNTIIRTVKLVTDENLSLQHSQASIIIAFAGRPQDKLLETITSLGEPIPVAIIMHSSSAFPGWWDEIYKQYSPLCIWPKTSDDTNLLSGDQSTDVSLIRKLDEKFPKSPLLSFYDNAGHLSQWHQQAAFSYIDTHNAVFLNEGMGNSTFRQTFRDFVSQARENKHPVAVIIGSEQTIEWTRNELNTFEKGGLSITAPPKISF